MLPPPPLTGRVGNWRAGLGRSLCSLFPRPFRDAGLACGDGEGTGERPASDGAVAGPVGKKPARVLVGLPERPQVIENWPWQRDDPLFVALADDPQLTIDAVDGRDLEGSPFTGTQAAGSDELH